MKVLLIQPRIGLLDDLRSTPEIPLSLLQLASNLPAMIKPVIFDQRRSTNWRKDLANLCTDDVVCAAITSMTSLQLGQAKKISIFLKKIGVKVVWGGPHATILPHQVSQAPYVDYVIVGEGENSFVKLVKDIRYGKAKHITSSPLLNIKKVKLANYDFVNKWKYVYEHKVFGKKYKTINIHTSRGCPNKCTYCYNQVANKSIWRPFDIKKIGKQIKQLYMDGITGFFFVDDNFFIDLKRAEWLFKFLIKEKINAGLFFQGICITDANKMTNEFLELMQRAGVRELWFGIESGSPAMRKKLNKEGSIKQIVNVNKILSDYKFSIQCNFMSGFPGETKNDVRDTIRLIFQLMKDNKKTACRPMTPFVPYPGTVLYDEAKRKGFIEPKTIKEYITFFSDINKQYKSFPWIRSPQKLEKIHLLSMFYNKDLQYINSTLVKWLIRLYRPIANYRLKKQIINYMPEYQIFRFFRRLFGFGFK